MAVHELYVQERRVHLIVRATVSDLDDVYEFLSKNFYPEHDFPGETGLSEEKARDYMFRYLQGGVVFNALQNGKIVGSISLGEASLWWSEDRYLGDGWFYVLPKARKSRVAIRLINEAFRYGEERGLPVVIGIWNADDIDRKDKFFIRKGMKRIGAWYMKGKF